MKALIITLGLLTHFSISAASLKQKDLNFNVKGEELLHGDVHYSVEIVTKKELRTKIPAFIELDASGFTKARNARLLVSKAAYVVRKPVGFFDHDKVVNADFLNHYFGDQKVVKIEDRTFKVRIPGSTSQTYMLRTHFDSDDISTTTSSRAIRAITGAKKMDIQVQGAQSIIMREMWGFSRGSYGAVHVTAYIGLTEDRTLVIDYGLMSLIPPLLADETLEESVSDEARAHQELLNTFTPR